LCLIREKYLCVQHTLLPFHCPPHVSRGTLFLANPKSRRLMHSAEEHAAFAVIVVIEKGFDLCTVLQFILKV
jgi:hypothetical protein